MIAIIAILAAILFPVFAKARDRAKSSACINNLKQIGTALSLYADDNEDFLPRAVRILQATPELPTSFSNVMSGYVKSVEVFRCPADANNSRYAPPGSNFWPAVLWKKYGLSYSYNSEDPNNIRPRDQWPSGWQTWRGGRRRAEFREPAAVGVTSDTNPWHLTKNNDVTDLEGAKQAAFNVQFLDGHVKQLFSEDRNVAMGDFPHPPPPSGG